MGYVKGAGVRTCALAERHPIRVVIILVAAGVDEEKPGALLEVAAVGVGWGATGRPAIRGSPIIHGCARQPQALCGGSAVLVLLDKAGADRARTGGFLDETSAVATYARDKTSMRAMGTQIQETLWHVIG